jgi:hypothetical protein
MAKIIPIIIACLFLTGCFKETCKCGTSAVYKRYSIVMPDRPELNVDKLDKESSIGEVTRSYENDLTNVIEYSLQLENIIKPIAESESGYEVEPAKLD